MLCGHQKRTKNNHGLFSWSLQSTGKTNNYGDKCKITIMINAMKQKYMVLWKDHGNSRHLIVGS